MLAGSVLHPRQPGRPGQAKPLTPDKCVDSLTAVHRSTLERLLTSNAPCPNAFLKSGDPPQVTSDPEVVGSPVLHHLLDRITLLHVIPQHGRGKRRQFGVASEAQANQLLRRELVDAALQVRG